jgi:hypothetical protein
MEGSRKQINFILGPNRGVKKKAKKRNTTLFRANSQETNFENNKIANLSDVFRCTCPHRYG